MSTEEASECQLLFKGASIMKGCLVLLVTFSCIIYQSDEPDPWFSMRYKIDNKLMRYEISRKQLDSAMFWNETDANPPLAVRKAIEISSTAINDLTSRGIIATKRDWLLGSVSLVPTNSEYWRYSVIYQDSVQEEREVTIIILMDGSWLIPKPESQ